MLASKWGPRGGLRTPLGFGVLVLLAFPRELGPGDFAAAIAPEAPKTARVHTASFAPAGGVNTMTATGRIMTIKQSDMAAPAAVDSFSKVVALHASGASPGADGWHRAKRGSRKKSEV